MKYTRLLIATVFSTMIFGCNDKDLFKDKGQEESGIQLKALTFDTIALQVEPNDEPNKYTIFVRWPKNSGAIKIIDENEVIYQATDKNNFFSFEAQGGSVHELEIQQKNSGLDYESILKRKIKVPADYIFSNMTSLSADFSFEGGRLYFSNGAILQSNKFNLYIKVDELISENGTIETFPISKKSSELTGDSGGNISILAKKARGKLYANIRGVNGGDGRDSFCIMFASAKCSASNGGNGGNAGFFSIEIADASDFELKKSLQFGLGGAGGIACKYIDASKPIPPGTIWDYNNGCEGWGRYGVNGIAGQNGTGQLCFKLSSEAKNECM